MFLLVLKLAFRPKKNQHVDGIIGLRSLRLSMSFSTPNWFFPLVDVRFRRRDKFCALVGGSVHWYHMHEYSSRSLPCFPACSCLIFCHFKPSFCNAGGIFDAMLQGLMSALDGCKCRAIGSSCFLYTQLLPALSTKFGCV